MKRGIPERGDILHLDLDPALGKEQQGQRLKLLWIMSWPESGHYWNSNLFR